ncbi:MAG: RidA family protein [Alphaproteobacteria bacterium]|nr:RidA family protein [Alphaproteobacteria bacterium]MBU1526215.1 RidA family protein [Alphaproteobacteria bacterium]MBU2117683.1 RidA family protein [Alphaproteobacteria bacterium]MBU2351372.1 RidA family protein [Alphaproteobacteria bacterium]MBU2382106.1 RidA family protein [Alphaproteobacteria bacterium]
MTLRPLTGDGSPPVEGSYPQAVEVTGATRWLFVSGQVPTRPDGGLADDFPGQCEQVWDNLETQLRAAGMALDNLVKVTTFLARREDAAVNRAVRLDRLQGRQPALTVIVTGIFDESWLVEIEAVACI